MPLRVLKLPMEAIVAWGRASRLEGCKWRTGGQLQRAGGQWQQSSGQPHTSAMQQTRKNETDASSGQETEKKDSRSVSEVDDSS